MQIVVLVNLEKTKVFPDVIKYKDESGNEHKDSNGKAYDSITVTMACNGKNLQLDHYYRWGVSY